MSVKSPRLVEKARDRYDTDLDAMPAEHLVHDTFGERVDPVGAATSVVFDASAFILATVIHESDGHDIAVDAVVAESAAAVVTRRPLSA
jgi:hypothetical protein